MGPDAIALGEALLERLAALGVGLPHRPPPLVSTEEFFAFWRAIDQSTPRRDLGLLLGAEAIERRYSVACAAALRAPDLGRAIDAMARYKRLTCPEEVEVLRADGEASVRFHWVLATSAVPPLLVDATFASFAALATRGTGGAVRPLRIELARRRADEALLRAHFACRVTFGAPVDRIVFAERALATPFVTADLAAFTGIAAGLEAELAARTPGRSMRRDVRVAIARRISGGERPSVEDVARRLGVSPRTLQRRLGEEGTTYQGELDAVRRTSARRLLDATDLAPVDIAFVLGFEEPNSFLRAFRSWERTTPLRWRARSAAGR